MSSVEKISVYSLADLKNTSDDALPNYLNSIGFKQSHYYADIRLALGFAAVIIAGALFGVDWKLGWEVTRPWTLPAVLAYMALNGAFTYWSYYVEGNRIYVGERKGAKLEIETKTDKINPIYNVKVKYTQAATKAGQEPKWTVVNLKSEFGKWFSEDGYFVARPFQHFLASSIPIVGEADPKNAAPYVEPTPKATTTSASTGPLQNVDVNIDNIDDVMAAIAQGNIRKRG